MQKKAYNGIDFILFSNPKFLVENLIPYLGLNSAIYIFKLADFIFLPLFAGIVLKTLPLFAGIILESLPLFAGIVQKMYYVNIFSFHFVCLLYIFCNISIYISKHFMDEKLLYLNSQIEKFG